MGVAGRDYMRDGGRPSGGWTPGRLTWLIIGINAVLWIVFSGAMNAARGVGRPVDPSSGLGGFIWTHLVLHPEAVLAQGRIWQAFTSMWLHDWHGASHVLFNMLALFFFGRTAEGFLGRRGFLWLYIGGGLACSLLYTAYAYVTGVFVPALGASGAVYAVLVWVACMQPRATVYLMLILPLPMWMAVGVLMVGLEVLTLTQHPLAAGAAVGHLSGALWGFVYFRWFRRWHGERGPGGWMVRLRRRRAPQRQARGPSPEAEVRARVDELLGRISRDGIESLSEEEKVFLQEASKSFR